MENNIKDLLYAVYKLDQIANRFNNKFKYMNLNLPLGQADRWSEEQTRKVVVALEAVYEASKEIDTIVENLEEPVLELIKSYTE
jgi:hypothetical protein